MSPTVILLAAGRARRFGSDKRKAKLNHHKTLLQASIDTIQTTSLPLFVVLASGDEDIAHELSAAGIDWAYCPDAHLGMGHSLAFGIESTPKASGWLIALADMPFIRSSTFNAVASQLQQHHIVVPQLADGRRGHPVGFSTGFRQQLIHCQGDQGARQIIKQQQPFLLLTDDVGIIADIDQPEDLRLFEDLRLPERQRQPG